MKTNTFTVSENKDALSFAQAMGFTTKTEAVSSKCSEALSFAYAMGLRKRPAREKKAASFSMNIFVPQLRFS